jgi:hypothetical protein
LVKFDKGVEKCDGDENATEVSVLNVILWKEEGTSIKGRKKR